jgi:hypothetical protein
MIEPLFLDESRHTDEPQRQARGAERFENRQPVEPASDADDFGRIEPMFNQTAPSHFGRRVDECGMVELVLQPPVAAVLINIIRVRRGAETVSVHPPEQPRGGGGRAAPRAVNERRRVATKLAEEHAGESGAEHVFPEVHPRRRPTRE